MSKARIVRLNDIDFVIAKDLDGCSVMFPVTDIVMMSEEKVGSETEVPDNTPVGSMITTVFLKSGDTLSLSATIEEIIDSASSEKGEYGFTGVRLEGTGLGRVLGQGGKDGAE